MDLTQQYVYEKQKQFTHWKLCLLFETLNILSESISENLKVNWKLLWVSFTIFPKIDNFMAFYMLEKILKILESWANPGKVFAPKLWVRKT